MIVRYYIKLTLYNYDIQSRYDDRKVYFNDLETATKEIKDLIDRYTQLSFDDIMAKTGKWCKRRGWSDAHVHCIHGLYKETTEKILV